MAVTPLPCVFITTGYLSYRNSHDLKAWRDNPNKINSKVLGFYRRDTKNIILNQFLLNKLCVVLYGRILIPPQD